MKKRVKAARRKYLLERGSSCNREREDGKRQEALEIIQVSLIHESS